MPPANKRYVSIQDLPQNQKYLYGIGLILLGSLIGYLMWQYPENLRVPGWVGWIAVSIFIWTGCAIALHGIISKKVYSIMMLVLVWLMSIIPLWIAFDPTEKQCRSNLFFLSWELPCRIAFGFWGIVILIFLIFGIISVWKKSWDSIETSDSLRQDL